MMNFKLITLCGLVACLSCFTQVISGEPDQELPESEEQNACYRHMNNDLEKVVVPELVQKLDGYIRSYNHVSMQDEPLKKILDHPTRDVSIVSAGFFKDSKTLEETQEVCADFVTQAIDLKSSAADVCEDQVSNLLDLMDRFNYLNTDNFDEEAKQYPRLVEILALAQACLVL